MYMESIRIQPDGHIWDAIYSPRILYDQLKLASNLECIYDQAGFLFFRFWWKKSFIYRFSRLVPDIYVKGDMDEVSIEMESGTVGICLRDLGMYKTVE